MSLAGGNSSGGYVSVGKGNCRLSDLEAALRPGSPVADLTDLTSGIASSDPVRQDNCTRGLRKLLSKGKSYKFLSVRGCISPCSPSVVSLPFPTLFSFFQRRCHSAWQLQPMCMLGLAFSCLSEISTLHSLFSGMVGERYGALPRNRRLPLHIALISIGYQCDLLCSTRRHCAIAVVYPLGRALLSNLHAIPCCSKHFRQSILGCAPLSPIQLYELRFFYLEK